MRLAQRLKVHTQASLHYQHVKQNQNPNPKAQNRSQANPSFEKRSPNLTIWLFMVSTLEQIRQTGKSPHSVTARLRQCVNVKRKLKTWKRDRKNAKYRQWMFSFFSLVFNFPNYRSENTKRSVKCRIQSWSFVPPMNVKYRGTRSWVNSKLYLCSTHISRHDIRNRHFPFWALWSADHLINKVHGVVRLEQG